LEHIKEFSKHAKEYDEHSSIQKEVAKHLIDKLDGSFKRVLDLGCGTGHIYRNIGCEIERFIGVDSAKGMLDLHPKEKNIQVLNFDFESDIFKEEILKYAPFDLVISSSTLQWSKDLEALVKFISTITPNIAFSIFTENTFKTLYKTTNLENFLPETKYLTDLVRRYFDIDYEIKEYKIDFEDTKSLFRYIKKSGVSGGKRKLSYKETKNLITKYPHKYLEFEVLFITNKKSH
jgi:malonyl-CoA O-methyltransferase